MEVKNLRIGNFILTNNKIIEIDFLTPYAIGYNNGNIGSNNSLLDNFKPIPLTEEWLLKFDFVKDRECFYKNFSNQGEFILFSNKTPVALANRIVKPFYFTCKTIVELEYVHQLQNIYFALTGEELEIKKEVASRKDKTSQ